MPTNTLSNKAISPVWEFLSDHTETGPGTGKCRLVTSWETIPLEDLAPEDRENIERSIIPAPETTHLMVGYMVQFAEQEQEYRASYWSVEYASGIYATKKRHVEHWQHAPTLPTAVALCEYHLSTGTFPEEFEGRFQPPYKLSYAWDQEAYVPVH